MAAAGCWCGRWMLVLVSAIFSQAAAAASPAHSLGYSVTIDNTKPRLDVGGAIANSHDGTIRFLEGHWWLHAASYGAGGCADPPLHGCQRVSPPTVPGGCGFQLNHNVSIYRSVNLSSGSWSYVGDALRCEELPGCKVLYRPHLVWNPNTELYTLFYNYVRKPGFKGGVGNGNGVATSASPAGPFVVRNPSMVTARPVLESNKMAAIGDFDVFVDDDGWAYMVRT